MNDVHRRSLCAGADLDSGTIVLGWGDPPPSALVRRILRAVGAYDAPCACAGGDPGERAGGCVRIDERLYSWRFAYHADASMRMPADAYAQRVFRSLTILPCRHLAACQAREAANAARR